MAFLAALELATDHEAMTRARPIGADVEAGEIDVALLLDEADVTGTWVSPLLALEEPSTDRIKFLNKVETSALRRLMAHGPRAHRLPWSLARAEVFGDAQARITQAIRSRVESDGWNRLIACDVVESYSEWQDRLVSLDAQVRKALRAALHVVMLREDKGDPDTVTHLHGENPETLYQKASETVEMELGDPRLESARETARRTFQSISRKGFGDEAPADSDTAIGFEIGAGALAAISDQIHAFLRVLENPDQGETDLAVRFAYDRDVFSDQFSRIYGAR